MCFIFCCLGGGRVLFFAVWVGGGGGVGGGGAFFFFFAVWAGACSFFAVWAGACFFFCCLGLGRVFFLLFGRGTGVHSLTRLPGSSLSDPTTKETEQQKKTRVPIPRLAVRNRTSRMGHASWPSEKGFIGFRVIGFRI